MKDLTPGEIKAQYSKLYNQVVEGAAGKEFEATKPANSEAEKLQGKQYDNVEPLDKDDPLEVWVTDYLDRIDPDYKDPKKDKMIKVALGALYGSQKEGEDFGFPKSKD